MGQYTLHEGDCLEAMRSLPGASVDAIVTDPPAGIFFMNRSWDSNKGGRIAWIAWLSEVMAEALRVAKPGAHALVWALPRTSHWTGAALEDAGWEVRDVVTHHFGSGFPKSASVGKALDKLARRDYVAAATRLGLEIPGRNHDDWTKESHAPGDKWWTRFREKLPEADWRAIEREVLGTDRSGSATIAFARETATEFAVTAPATDAAKQWDGWGTALKPATEFWFLVRKPLSEAAIAANVLTHGTGGLNIDGCRVSTSAAEREYMEATAHPNGPTAGFSGVYSPMGKDAPFKAHNAGRWPANVVLTHAPTCEDGACDPSCPVRLLDEQSGTRTSGLMRGGTQRVKSRGLGGYGKGFPDEATTHDTYGDSGGASRFFPIFKYTAKASTRERTLPDGTRHTHPTTKPLELCRWLVRLVTPPHGVVLDPFMGSGTTGVACLHEGFRFIGIEREPEYMAIARQRLAAATQPSLGVSEASS